MVRDLRPEDWGLECNDQGELSIGGRSSVDLARAYGTPLHVIHAERLKTTARDFADAARVMYPGRVSIHFAMKCNSVPGVVALIRSAGLRIEVTTEYELRLALQLGFEPGQIIVNGPGKRRDFLQLCVDCHVRLVVVDAPEEVAVLASLDRPEGGPTDILLRVNPAVSPRGLTQGAATGSRRRSPFGLDLKGGEVIRALRMVHREPAVRFMGFHMHIGTGIRDPRAYREALACLPALRRHSEDTGSPIRVLDVGGGFGSPNSRGMSTLEMAMYETFGILPASRRHSACTSIEEFIGTISDAIRDAFPRESLPELVVEPGRSIAGPNQHLLLTVQAVKHRPGVRTWVITDGGVSTVSLPTYYERHQVLLANDLRRRIARRVTLTGAACFAGDIVYKNILMPDLRTGDILAVMDSGAYFTALESSFGFPRPAIVAVEGSEVRLLRRRETYPEMVSRDIVDCTGGGHEFLHRSPHP